MLVELEQMDQFFYEAHVQIIDQHLAKFTARMHEWHGTLESQSDIPDSVKEAFGESDRGEIIPFPEK